MVCDLRLLDDLLPSGLPRPSAPADPVLLQLIAEAAGEDLTWSTQGICIAPPGRPAGQTPQAPSREKIDTLAVLALRLGQCPDLEPGPVPPHRLASWLAHLVPASGRGRLILSVDPTLDSNAPLALGVPGGLRPLPRSLLSQGGSGAGSTAPRETLLGILVAVARQEHAVLAVESGTLRLIPAGASKPGSIVLIASF